MTAALTVVLIVGAVVNLPPLLLGQIVTKSAAEGKPVDGYDVFPNITHIRTFSDIAPYLILLTALIVARELLTLVRKYLVEKVATSIEADEYYLVAKHVLSLDLSEYTDIRSGAVNQKMNQGIEGLVQFLKISFMDFVPIIITAISAFVVAVFQNAYMALTMAVVAFAGILATGVQLRSQRGVKQYLLEAKTELSANITEVLNGIDYVRAAGMAGREEERTKQVTENFRKTEFRHHKWMMSFDSAKQLVEGLGYVTIIGLSAWLASRGTIEFGKVLTFTMLYAIFTSPLQNLHRMLDEGGDAIQKINGLIKTYNKRSDPGLNGTQKVTTSAKPIVCRDVSVSYSAGGTSHVLALDRIDFDVSDGEVVGIAGPSGSGKSTLIKLILGLTADYKGTAQLFGVEARDIDKAELAARIAYVPQTPFLIKASIRENACYTAAETPTSSELENAMRSARFAEKVAGLPDGLDAEIAEQGRNLSGGERQRLALTRLFLSKAQLLVLDEPTAALDAESQEAVQEAIFDVAGGRSAIVVAHRLNTLRKADRIVVLDKGRIVEMGAYTELANKAGGLFKRLVEIERLERQSNT